MLTFDPDYVRHLRERSGLSRPRLAELLDVPASRVYDWEDGKSCPSGAHLVMLSEFFAVHPRDLFEEFGGDWRE